MNIKHAAISVLLICLGAYHASAQRKIQQIDEEKREQDEKVKEYEKRSFWQDVKFGGSIGGYFGSGAGTKSSMFIIQPFAAYQINDNALAGLGVTYVYWSVGSPGTELEFAL